MYDNPAEAHPPTMLLTTSDVAKRLAVSTDRVRQLARAGHLTYVKTDLGRLFDPASVDSLAAARASSRAS